MENRDCPSKNGALAVAAYGAAMVLARQCERVASAEFPDDRGECFMHPGCRDETHGAGVDAFGPSQHGGTGSIEPAPIGWTAGIAAGFGRVLARGVWWIAMVVAPAFSDSGHGETHRWPRLQSNAGPATCAVPGVAEDYVRRFP